MAANWLRGWMNSSRRADKRTVARRQELRLDHLEDRTVPATVAPLIDATDALPNQGHDSETSVAINGANPDNIFASSNQIGQLGSGAPQTVGVTQDGGLTWVSSTIPTTESAPSGDPASGSYRDGRLLFNQMEVDAANPGGLGQ